MYVRKPLNPAPGLLLGKRHLYEDVSSWELLGASGVLLWASGAP